MQVMQVMTADADDDNLNSLMPAAEQTQGYSPDLCSMSFASLLTWLQGLKSLGLDNRMRRLLANKAWTKTLLAVLLQRAKAIILPAGCRQPGCPRIAHSDEAGLDSTHTVTCCPPQ